MVISAMKKVKQGQGEREGWENIDSRAAAVLCGEGQESAINEVVFEKRTDVNVRREVMLLPGDLGSSTGKRG